MVLYLNKKRGMDEYRVRTVTCGSEDLAGFICNSHSDEFKEKGDMSAFIYLKKSNVRMVASLEFSHLLFC